jgi:carboxyl-terminal processing protease
MKTTRWTMSVTTIGLALLAAACGARDTRRPAFTPIPTIEPTARQLRVFDAAWEAVNEQYVSADFNGVDWPALGDQYRARVADGLSDDEFAAAMHELLDQLDPQQATFETRSERLEQETADRRTYHGIGAFISFRQEPEPHVVILSVIEDSPAEGAGLEAHDSIFAVDGEPFVAEDAEAPAERIRGDPNSSVDLTVQSPGETPRQVTIQRAEILAADVLRGGYLEQLGIAYYRVPVAADASLAQTIGQSLLTIAGQGPLRGVIVDLRVARSGNGSWPLAPMLTLFGDGIMGEFYTRTGADPLAIRGQDIGGSQTVPMTVLVGPDTEGSPEIFAAALQANGRATVLGLPTPGAVEGFSEVPLPDGSRLFLATSSFRTDDSLDLAASGLTPDVPIRGDWDEITSADDPVLEAALALLLSQ